MDLLNLTPRQFKRAAVIKQRIAALTNELTRLLGASDKSSLVRRRSKMSAAGRRRIAAAQRARWMKQRRRESRKTGTRTRKKTAAKANASRSAKMKAYWAKKKAGRS